MLSSIIGFLAMLNPFALFLYLDPVMRELSDRDFMKVLLNASLISFGIFLLFLLIGDAVFVKVFQINFNSFRIFGGIVIFSFAYFFIVKGQKALIVMKEDLNDLASEIALPFMVGAGTISLTIMMSHEFSLLKAIIMLFIILFFNYFFILFLKFFRDMISKRKMKVAFDKNMEILLRVNGFFVGAIGIDLIITGIKSIFF
ncbi:MarC family protein [Nanoarchaeota archaeon]